MHDHTTRHFASRILAQHNSDPGAQSSIMYDLLAFQMSQPPPFRLSFDVEEQMT